MLDSEHQDDDKACLREGRKNYKCCPHTTGLYHTRLIHLPIALVLLYFLWQWWWPSVNTPLRFSWEVKFQRIQMLTSLVGYSQWPCQRELTPSAGQHCWPPPPPNTRCCILPVRFIPRSCNRYVYTRHSTAVNISSGAQQMTTWNQ